MAEARKKIFNYGIPWYKKYLNRFCIEDRLVLYTGILILAASSGTIIQGLRNTNAEYIKNRWIRTHVRNIKDDTYAKLDEEKPPLPFRQNRK